MRSRALIALVLLAVLGGCQTLQKPTAGMQFPQDRPSPEYTKTWEAAKAVMGRYFMLRLEDFDRGVLVAEPEVGANPLTKYRTRVVAQLVQSGHSLWDVDVRVMNEVDVSEPNTWGAQPGNDWATVAFDKVLEARLVNEINVERFGRPAFKFDYRYMKLVPSADAQPAKHKDLLKALRQSGTSAAPPSKANPTKLEKDGTHLAYIMGRPEFGDRFTMMMARGDIALRRDELDDAVIEFGTAAEQVPNEPSAQVALSHTYLAQGQYPKAALSLRKALALGTGWLGVPLDRGKLYGDPTAFNGQIGKLKQHVESHPDDLAARFVFGYTLLCKGDRPASVAQFEAVLQKDPNDSAARALLDTL